MIIQDKKTGLVIYPNFDSGSYMGSWTFLHKELEYIDSSDPKWDVCSMLMSAYIGKYLDGTLNEVTVTSTQEYTPHQKGYQTDCDAKSIIENEGIGYAVTRYIDAEQFTNAETRKLWYNACKALEDLQDHLGVE